MKLSTRGRYGLKAIYQLSQHYGDGPIPLKSIADKENLSESYLEQLFGTLRRNNLLESVRGAQGGYMLSREPNKITVGEVLRILEGDLAPADCIGAEDFECKNEEDCVTKNVWLKIKNSIDEVVDSITLQDMLDDNIGSYCEEDK